MCEASKKNPPWCPLISGTEQRSWRVDEWGHDDGVCRGLESKDEESPGWKEAFFWISGFILRCTSSLIINTRLLCLSPSETSPELHRGAAGPSGAGFVVSTRRPPVCGPVPRVHLALASGSHWPSRRRPGGPGVGPGLSLEG